MTAERLMAVLGLACGIALVVGGVYDLRRGQDVLDGVVAGLLTGLGLIVAAVSVVVLATG